MKKVICIVNDNIDYINLELYCFEQNFFKSKLIKKFEYVLTEENILDISNNIQENLNENEFNKASCVFGISSPFFFTESIIIPKIGMAEENKTCMLKLDKLYKNFNDLFVSIHEKYTYNKSTRRHLIIAIRKQIYSDILEKINKLSLNVEKIVFSPLALANNVGKNRIFQTDKIGLYVNIKKHSSLIVIVKGHDLIDFYNLKEGYDSFINQENIFNIDNAKEYASRLVKEIKKLSYQSEINISEFDINCEINNDKLIYQMIEKELNVTFRSSSNRNIENIEDLLALCIFKSKCTPLPVKVK